MDYQSQIDTRPRRPGKHKAATAPPGEGVEQSAATVKVDGFPKTKNIDK
jgi:hypothetical protein